MRRFNGFDFDHSGFDRSGGGFLGRRLLDRLWLLGLRGLLCSHQPVTMRSAADHVGIRLVQGRGMALDRYAENAAELNRLCIREAKFLGQFVYS
jgi:hypothetical protein